MARASAKHESSSAYHHGDLPAALLRAVAEIIEEHGVGAVSLREAARRAGVSHGAPAHHFKHKAGLLSAFAADGFCKLDAKMREAEQTTVTADASALLKAQGKAYIAFAIENRASFEVMFRPEMLDLESQELHEASTPPFARLLDACAACQAQGHAAHLPLESLATTAWSLVHGLATLWINQHLQLSFPELKLETLTNDAISLLVDGL